MNQTIGNREDAAVSRRRFVKLGSLSMLAAGVASRPQKPALAQAPAAPARGRTHVVVSSERTVRVGIIDPSAPPAVTIDSGDVVHYPNTWINWANEAKYGMSFEEREPIRRKYPQGPYSLVGPVAVRGAEPGDVIECRMLRLRPIDWGWNSAPRGVGALPADFDKPFLRYFRFDEDRQFAEFRPGVRVPLAPFQGVMATTPAGDKPVSGILSGPYGGNIVLRELTEGSSLFLPVFRPGGLLWTGDSHAAQGDGVVNQTAIETAMEDLRVQYILHKRSPVRTPMAETSTHWIGLGFGANLDDALTACLRTMIDWLNDAGVMEKAEAYALLSMTGSFRITQYSNQTGTAYTSIPAKTVHGMLPKTVFSADARDLISARMRGAA